MREHPPRAALEARWSSDAAAGRYAAGRFASARAERRDLRLLARLLARHGLGSVGGAVLDVPCGAGRLSPALRELGAYVGADVSAAMLREAQRFAAGPLVRASARCLPFRDGAFELVVCCRLLHHLSDERELAEVARELARVARRAVAVSFWDATSWQAWRRRVGLRRDSSGRAAIEKSRLERVFAGAGAGIAGYAHSFRFVSPQAFALFVKGR